MIFAAPIAARIRKLTVDDTLALRGNLGSRRHLWKGSTDVIGPLGTANREIREAERCDELRRLARLAEPRRLTDLLLGQLEELNLDGVLIVPDSYEPGLAELRGHLIASPRVAARLIQRLQSGRRTGELIEAVFTIQEIIAQPVRPPGTPAIEEADLV